jgi:hypothetical protein
MLALVKVQPKNRNATAGQIRRADTHASYCVIDPQALLVPTFLTAPNV